MDKKKLIMLAGIGAVAYFALSGQATDEDGGVVSSGSGTIGRPFEQSQPTVYNVTLEAPSKTMQKADGSVSRERAISAKRVSSGGYTIERNKDVDIYKKKSGEIVGGASNVASLTTEGAIGAKVFGVPDLKLKKEKEDEK